MQNANPMTRRHFLSQSRRLPVRWGWRPDLARSRKRRQPKARQKESPLAGVEPIPCGAIGKVKISRMLLGGNLIAGHMHARDLKYVGSLFRAYATEEKILETLKVAEQHGINTVFKAAPATSNATTASAAGICNSFPILRCRWGRPKVL